MKSKRLTVNGELTLLLTEEPVQFERLEESVEYMYLELVKNNQNMTTCNRLDLKSLGF